MDLKNNGTVPFKVCCIQGVDEARLAIQYGASAIGLVAEMPSGPGVISERKIAEIAREVSDEVNTFLLTSETDIQAIIEQHSRCRTRTIQIVDRLDKGTHEELRDALPGVNLVQVIHVNDRQSVREAIETAPYVDALLLDSGNQALEVKKLGGTGETHDWSLSREIVDKTEVPVFLAGGLNADNVRDALKNVNPFGLDICSGLRTRGKLDKTKLNAFVENLPSGRFPN